MKDGEKRIGTRAYHNYSLSYYLYPPNEYLDYRFDRTKFGPIKFFVYLCSGFQLPRLPLRGGRGAGGGRRTRHPAATRTKDKG